MPAWRTDDSASNRGYASRATRFPLCPVADRYLHLGHALSAGLNARLATERGGRFLLRIEDIDPTRRRPDHVAAITQDLAWLGLRWEEPVLHQSSRMAAYRTGLEALKARGLVYPCFCSRKALALQHAALGPDHPCDPDGVPLYPGICRNLPDDERDDRIRLDRTMPGASTWRAPCAA